MSQQFRERVSGYSDAQLVDILRNPETYTPESVRIVEEEAELRGGLKAVFDGVDAENARTELLWEVVKLTKAGIAEGVEEEEMVKRLAAKGITGDDVLEQVGGTYHFHRLHVEQSTDTLNSTLRGVIGGIVASIIGGVYLSLTIIGKERTVVILVLGFPALHYSLVRWSSGNKNTSIVIIITLLSMGGAVLVGLWLHQLQIFPAGPNSVAYP